MASEDTNDFKLDLDASGAIKALTHLNKALKIHETSIHSLTSVYSKGEKGTKKYRIRVEGLTEDGRKVGLSFRQTEKTLRSLADTFKLAETAASKLALSQKEAKDSAESLTAANVKIQQSLADNNKQAKEFAKSLKNNAKI